MITHQLLRLNPFEPLTGVMGLGRVSLARLTCRLQGIHATKKRRVYFQHNQYVRIDELGARRAVFVRFVVSLSQFMVAFVSEHCAWLVGYFFFDKCSQENVTCLTDSALLFAFVCLACQGKLNYFRGCFVLDLEHTNQVGCGVA